MKENVYFLTVLLFLIIGIVFFFSYKHKQNRNSAPSSSKTIKHSLKIGWQVPWATEGQLTQILKRTDILKNNGIEAEFKGFSYGGPLNEAALASEVDIIFTADQPMASLLANNSQWTIVGRLMYNRVSLYVPPKSTINEVADLKGKTVAMPFGAAAQRMALLAEKKAGLDPQKDVNNVNLGIYEQSDLVRTPESSSWGEIDAMAGFDPTPAIFAEKGLIKNLEVGKVVSVIAVDNKLIEEDPEAVVAFLGSFYAAYDYYRLNVSRADRWFIEESGLDITPSALQIAASIEPNLSVSSSEEIRITFNDDDYKIMQEAADFIYDQGLVKKKVVMKDHINMSFAEKALEK